MNRKEEGEEKQEVVRLALDRSSIFSPQTLTHPSLQRCRMRSPVNGRQEPRLRAWG